MPPAAPPSLLSTRQRRAAFWLYALALFTATHWPALDIRIQSVPRPDLIAHFSVFATWYLLLFAAAFFGPLRRSGVPRILAIPWVIAVGYAAVDEGLQLLPFIQRHAAWDDLAANIGGITLGLTAAGAWLVVFGRARGEQSPA